MALDDSYQIGDNGLPVFDDQAVGRFIGHYATLWTQKGLHCISYLRGIGIIKFDDAHDDGVVCGYRFLCTTIYAVYQFSAIKQITPIQLNRLSII